MNSIFAYWSASLWFSSASFISSFVYSGFNSDIGTFNTKCFRGNTIASTSRGVAIEISLLEVCTWNYMHYLGPSFYFFSILVRSLFKLEYRSLFSLFGLSSGNGESFFLKCSSKGIGLNSSCSCMCMKKSLMYSLNGLCIFPSNSSFSAFSRLTDEVDDYEYSWWFGSVLTYWKFVSVPWPLLKAFDKFGAMDLLLPVKVFNSLMLWKPMCWGEWMFL